jgi:hypothetical protein
MTKQPLRPGDFPKAGDFVKAVSTIGEKVEEAKETVIVGPGASDSEIGSRCLEKIRAAIVKNFPPETGVDIQTLGSSVLLSRGKSRIEVRVEITRVSRKETLNISPPAYIWDLRISRDSDLFTICKVFGLVVLGALFIISLRVEDLVKAFIYLLGLFVLVGLAAVGSIVSKRSHKDFPSEQVDLLRLSLGQILAAELAQKS